VDFLKAPERFVKVGAKIPQELGLEDSDRFRFPPISFCALARDCSGHGGD